LDGNLILPADPRTKVEFSIPEAGYVSIEVFNLKGALTRTLYGGQTRQRSIILSWDGKNDADEDVAAGSYIYLLKSKNHSDTRRIFLTR
jgi:flagellar hook assembly protein FlgD